MKTISYSLNQIQIGFCTEKKKIYFSAPISSAVHRSVQAYVRARENKVFGPFDTSYEVVGHQVCLVQAVPFQAGPQTRLRYLTTEFRRLANRCSQMLLEMAIEENHRIASFDSESEL